MRQHTWLRLAGKTRARLDYHGHVDSCPVKQTWFAFARRAPLLAATLAVETGCATLGGTTRHFDEARIGPSVIRSSERLPAQDRLEVSADGAGYAGAIRARVSRILACRVLRRTPRAVTTTTTQTASPLLFGAETTIAIVGVVVTGAYAMKCWQVRVRHHLPHTKQLLYGRIGNENHCNGANYEVLEFSVKWSWFSLIQSFKIWNLIGKLRKYNL